MNPMTVRVRITYRTESSGKRHEPTYDVSSSLELFDRFLKLKAKRIAGLSVYIKLPHTGRFDKPVAWSGKIGVDCVLIDPDRLDDTEYMEGKFVEIWDYITAYVNRPRPKYAGRRR
jgi:hypothetical protein